MKTKRFQKILLTVILMAAFGFSLSAGDTPKEVSTAAEQGLSRFLSGDFPNDVFNFADWKKPGLGFGFEVFTLAPGTQWPADEELDLHAGVTTTGEWRFVIENDNKPVALITIANVDGKWMTVGISARDLSEEVVGVTKEWSEDKGYDLRFIRLFKAKADFMEIRKGQKVVGFVPFKSARIALGLDSEYFTPDTVLSNSDVVIPLREILSKRLSREMY
jgi:hypothetical protein